MKTVGSLGINFQNLKHTQNFLQFFQKLIVILIKNFKYT